MQDFTGGDIATCQLPDEDLDGGQAGDAYIRFPAVLLDVPPFLNFLDDPTSIEGPFQLKKAYKLPTPGIHIGLL